MPGSHSPKPPRRRWTTIDGMILVAATGVGLFCVKPVDSDIWDMPLQSRLRTCAMLAHPTMLAWATGLLVIGRIHRREPLWRLLRRPGLCACVFSLAGAAFSLLIAKGEELFHGEPIFWREPFLDYLLGTYNSPGCFILVTWTTLLLTRSWRPVSDWADRLGRILGATWIAVMIAVGLGF